MMVAAALSEETQLLPPFVCVLVHGHPPCSRCHQRAHLPQGGFTFPASTHRPPVEFLCLEQARAAGEVVISETGATEWVRLENRSKHSLFFQAGEMIRGGNQDRTVAGDLSSRSPKQTRKPHSADLLCGIRAFITNAGPTLTCSLFSIKPFPATSSERS